jgi:hypothetical protein
LEAGAGSGGSHLRPPTLSQPSVALQGERRGGEKTRGSTTLLCGNPAKALHRSRVTRRNPCFCPIIGLCLGQTAVCMLDRDWGLDERSERFPISHEPLFEAPCRPCFQTCPTEVISIHTGILFGLTFASLLNANGASMRQDSLGTVLAPLMATACTVGDQFRPYQNMAQKKGGDHSSCLVHWL